MFFFSYSSTSGISSSYGRDSPYGRGAGGSMNFPIVTEEERIDAQFRWFLPGLFPAFLGVLVIDQVSDLFTLLPFVALTVLTHDNCLTRTLNRISPSLTNWLAFAVPLILSFLSLGMLDQETKTETITTASPDFPPTEPVHQILSTEASIECITFFISFLASLSIMFVLNPFLLMKLNICRFLPHFISIKFIYIFEALGILNTQVPLGTVKASKAFRRQLESDSEQHRVHKDSTCAICLDQISATASSGDGIFAQCGATGRKLACDHAFHLDCVGAWFEKSCTCPVCRMEFETDNPIYEYARMKRKGVSSE